MKKLILLFILTLISLLGICQTDYPKKAVIDSDTVVLITPSQVTKINLTFNDLDRYKTKSDSLVSLVSVYDQHDSLKDKIILNQKEQIINYKKQDGLSQEVITSLDNQVKKQKKYRNISAGISILLLILLIIK